MTTPRALLPQVHCKNIVNRELNDILMTKEFKQFFLSVPVTTTRSAALLPFTSTRKCEKNHDVL